MKSLILTTLLKLTSSSEDASCNPTQIHVVGGLIPETSMTVSFMTESEACKSTVNFGTNADSLILTATNPSPPLQYTSNTTKYGDYTSQFIHHVSIKNLTPRTIYFYQPLNSPTATAYSFTTQKTSQANFDDYPMKFAVVGDLGQTNNSEATVAHIANDGIGFDAVLQAGDMSYADAEQDRWDIWFNMIEYVAASTPWYVSAGNHEIEINDLNYDVFQAYENRFRMPWTTPAKLAKALPEQFTGNPTPSVFSGSYDFGNSFYETKIGPAHIIFLNSYSGTGEDSDQYRWLVQTLATINRKVTPWLLVFYHCPSYNSFDDHQNEPQEIAMKQAMEHLFVENRVNMIFTGHVHGYERTYGVAYEKRDETAPIYVIIGDGGNREGHAKGERAKRASLVTKCRRVLRSSVRKCFSWWPHPLLN